MFKPFCGALVCLVVGCAEYAAVPPNDFSSLDRSPQHGYRLITTDGQSYTVKRFALTDSTIVVESIVRRRGAEAGPLPFEVSFRDVHSIEEIDVDFVVPIVVAAGLVSLLVAISNISIGAP